MSPTRRAAGASTAEAFDVAAYLASTGPGRMIEKCRRRSIVFSQGDRATDIRYVQKARLSVLSGIGKEAVVALLGPGDFFAEGVLAGQSIRIATATAVAPSTVLVIERESMVRLRSETTFADRFLSYILARNLRLNRT
jgi:CRP-like cAMP-binding protein